MIIKKLMFKPKMRILAQGGDTIVEVLVCMAVVSLALGGAFVATRNSQLGVRDSQEHAEALQLMQSQVEQLRGDTSDTASIFSPGAFCMYNGTKTASTNCTQNSAGQSGQADSRYLLSVNCGGSTCPDAATGGYVFTISATWDEVYGGGKATEQLVYRMYQ
jgi:type II secretory pathway pseudopilin PulG